MRIVQLPVKADRVDQIDAIGRLPLRINFLHFGVLQDRQSADLKGHRLKLLPKRSQLIQLMQRGQIDFLSADRQYLKRRLRQRQIQRFHLGQNRLP